MSIFNDLLPKIKKIPNAFIKSFNDDLKIAFDNLDKFEEEFLKAKGKARDKTQKEKNTTTLQSIHEDEDESTKSDASSQHRSSAKSVTETTGKSSAESEPDQPKRASKKRNKNEVDDVFSPEQDKRLKRNASVKAQSIISKQVNVNLTQKLRRENSTEKVEKPQSSRSRRRKDDDKENTQPIIQIKEEKVSLPPEPELMEMESLPLIIPIKQEVDKDDIAMPPPAVPLPKARRAAAKDKPKEDESSEDEGGRRRTTRTRKQTDTAPVAAPRSTRGSRATQAEAEEPAPADARPKRTRAKKKPTDVVNGDVEKDAQASILSGIESSTEKPRPKRTRKIQKAAYVDTDKESEPETQPEHIVSPKEERVSAPEVKSPILPLKVKNNIKDKDKQETEKKDKEKERVEVDAIEKEIMNETHVLKDTPAVTDMDKTVILPNGHTAPAQKTMNMNETVVLETRPAMDATVVLNNDPKGVDITDDNSLITDDSDSAHTPPPKQPPTVQPTSAVKEKVQQFEEMASRVTRTKTRAMAKKEDPVENQTPPDKIVKAVLSSDTLHKMNDMIFNGKPPQHQTSSSAVKPRAAVPVPKVASSASKLSALRAARDAEERDREDARRKKEALLDAKRELQRKKREEKMAAAAAARDAAERERRAAHSAAASQRDKRQHQLDCGRQDRLRDIERKKMELARKVAETEERRRAEELARRQRLASEQRKADEQRRRQLTEAENVRKEAALMEKEIEKRQKEYMEKQKMKHRIEDKMHTPLKTVNGVTTGVGAHHMEPVYMCDGFQYLVSDEDSDPPERPVPDWSTSKARRLQLTVQSGVAAAHVDRLFSVRVHSPDLRLIFPDIERARLKRTSSAVWRTPPRLPALQE
ncbi:inner centromere protein A [Manduca sexta]|uniref:Uncharacterized protein n=1 Tax=Manduca sexta TaxID=7130 RepID=A0A922CFH9_MANSE|nr:inner centromere protein A [Manduca sexta]KAG6443478.1 hypothetical protein O3G_MSEX002860 [Manduca sexta]